MGKTEIDREREKEKEKLNLRQIEEEKTQRPNQRENVNTNCGNFHPVQLIQNINKIIVFVSMCNSGKLLKSLSSIVAYS